MEQARQLLLESFAVFLILVRGSVTVDGFDIQNHYKQARSLIGLVPQELATDTFESVWNAVTFSRGLFGKQPNRFD